jgi:hypothetical protein
LVEPPGPPPAINKIVAEIDRVGVALLLAALTGPVPWPLVAVTVKVYAVPLDKPVTTTGEDAPVPVNPPGDEVTVYVVIALDPTFVGSVKATDAWASPAVAVPIIGALGKAGQLPPMSASRTSFKPQRPYAFDGDGKVAMV